MYSAKLFIVAALLLFVSTETLTAQLLVDPETKDIAIVGPMKLLGDDGQVDLLLVLAEKEMRKDIELVDYQEQEVSKLIESVGIANFVSNNEYGNLLVTSPPEKQESITENYKMETATRQVAANDTLNKTLLPDQIKLIRKVAVERELGNMGLMGLLTREGAIQSLLKLTDEEKKMLQKESVKIRTELAKKIAELKKEAVIELLGKLPEDKIKILEDKFDIKF
jgi:hypothetical protein